jgi:hypothetical protein
MIIRVVVADTTSVEAFAVVVAEEQLTCVRSTESATSVEAFDVVVVEVQSTCVRSKESSSSRGALDMRAQHRECSVSACLHVHLRFLSLLLT